MVGLAGLGGLFQPQQSCDSLIVALWDGQW